MTAFNFFVSSSTGPFDTLLFLSPKVDPAVLVLKKALHV